VSSLDDNEDEDSASSVSDTREKMSGVDGAIDKVNVPST
jgi:hypothetical protein